MRVALTHVVRCGKIPRFWWALVRSRPAVIKELDRRERTAGAGPAPDTGGYRQMRGKLIVGNWKMNGGLAANAALLVALLAGWKAAAGPADGGLRAVSVSWAGARRACGFADRVGRAGRERARGRRVYRRGLGRHARGVRMPLRAGRAFGAAAVARRDGCDGRGQGQGGAGGRIDADRVRRRNARRTRRRAVAGGGGPAVRRGGGGVGARTCR